MQRALLVAPLQEQPLRCPVCGRAARLAASQGLLHIFPEATSLSDLPTAPWRNNLSAALSGSVHAYFLMANIIAKDFKFKIFLAMKFTSHSFNITSKDHAM